MSVTPGHAWNHRFDRTKAASVKWRECSFNTRVVVMLLPLFNKCVVQQGTTKVFLNLRWKSTSWFALNFGVATISLALMLNYFLAEGTIVSRKGSILMLILVCALENQSSERMRECVEFPGKHRYHLITKMHKIILIVFVHIYALVDIVVSCLL